MVMKQAGGVTDLQSHGSGSARRCAFTSDEEHPDPDAKRRHHREHGHVNVAQNGIGLGRHQLDTDAKGYDEFVGSHGTKHVPENIVLFLDDLYKHFLSDIFY